MTVMRDLQAAAERAGRGDLDGAARLCRRVLAKDAQQPDANYFLGRILRDTGRANAGLTHLDRAAASRVGDPAIHYFRALALIDLGRLPEALEAMRAAVRFDPGSPQLHADLGSLLGRIGQFADAVAALETAAALAARDGAVQAQLAIAYCAVDRFEVAAATARRAAALAPHDVRAHLALGEALAALAQYEDSAAAYDAALALMPDCAPALLGLGNVRARQGRYREAVGFAVRVRTLTPHDPQAAALHGNALLWSGDRAGAIAQIAAARDMPGQSARDQALHGSVLVGVRIHDPDMHAAALAAVHREWDVRYGLPRRASWRPHDNDRTPLAGEAGHRRLRIGYVSPDFYRHSVAVFFAPTLEAHDRARVEIACYSDCLTPDEITARIRAAADLWRPIRRQDDAAVAELIRRDRIDILVDLTGHQGGNRLSLFALKPAPVQATWLGYPGTTGVSAIDWRISDAACDPESEDAFSAERVVRLAGFHAYAPPHDAPDVAPLPAAAGAPFTFGSFNNVGKITDATMRLWSAAMAGVPGSRLLLKSSLPGDAAVRAALLDRFAAAGIAGSHIELLPRAGTLRDHLALYGRIDLALDTTPYCGTTTTCEALWMGVPVLTLRGDRHAARVGASLLGRAGLDDFVAERAEDFASRAAAWAERREALAALRGGMRARLAASPLCDVAAFTRALEDVYRMMWRSWCEAPPVSR